MKLEPVDLDESASVAFGEGRRAGSLEAMETRAFERLSAALTFVMETLEEKHRPGAFITTKSGSVYHWDAIPTLYEHVRIARGH